MKKRIMSVLLALVMALSLCTVALAEPADGAGTTTSMTINSIQFSFDKSAYAYGSSVYVDGKVNTSKVNDVDATTSASAYAGVVGLANGTTDGSHGAEIYVVDSSGNYVPYTENSFEAGTQYYLRILFKLQPPTNDDSITSVSFNTNPSFSVSDNCSLVGLDGSVICATADRYETANNDGFCAVYFKLSELTVVGGSETLAFTKVVTLGGNTAPTATTFTLVRVGVAQNITITTPNGTQNNTTSAAQVSVSGTVNTNGAGTYTTGTLTISCNDVVQLNTLLNDGFFVQEKNDGAPNWTYDNTVWKVQRKLLREVATDLGLSPTDSTDGYVIVAKKALLTDNGYVEADSEKWCYVADMTFTNVYTKNVHRVPSSTTPTAKIEAPKTFDAGIAVYGVMAVSSLFGMGYVGKKKF